MPAIVTGPRHHVRRVKWLADGIQRTPEETAALYSEVVKRMDASIDSFVEAPFVPPKKDEVVFAPEF